MNGALASFAEACGLSSVFPTPVGPIKYILLGKISSREDQTGTCCLLPSVPKSYSNCSFGVAVHGDQALLVLDRADGGADFERAVELGSVGAGQVGEEARGPGAAVAVVLGQVAVDGERGGDGHGDQELAGDAVGEIVFVLDALQAIGVGLLVLALQRGERAAHGWRHRGAPAAERDGPGDRPVAGLRLGGWGVGCYVSLIGRGGGLICFGVGLPGCGLRLGRRNRVSTRRTRPEGMGGELGAGDAGRMARACCRMGCGARGRLRR